MPCGSLTGRRGSVASRGPRSPFPCIVAFVWLSAAAPAAAGTIYWNMSDPATPSVNGVPNLFVSEIAQGNSTTSGTSGQSVSGGYAFMLDGTSTAASGGSNLNFSAKTGALVTGSSSYLTLTLTPAAGYSGTLSAIGFGSRSTSSGPTTLSLRTSIDGYAGDVAVFPVLANGTWASFTNTFAAPIGFTSATPVSLRLYGSGGTVTTAGNWRIDDFQVSVISVPEPAAVSLAIVGAAGVVAALRGSGRRRTGRRGGRGPA